MTIQPVHYKGALRLFASIALAVLLLSPIFNTAQIVYASVPFYVNTKDDIAPGPIGDGICNNGAGWCGLREAVAEAFNIPNKTIFFDSSLAGKTIHLSGLPLAVDGNLITIDGETNNITISGSDLPVSAPAVIQVDGNNNTIRNLTIRDSPWDGIQVGDLTGTGNGNNNLLDGLTIIHNVSSGIYFSGGDGNHVQMTLIGTVNNSAPACVPAESNAYGVYVGNGASNTMIGGNLMDCNLRDGISVDGTNGTHNVTISTNGIGTNANDSSVGNQWAGIAVYNGAQHVTISGPNAISGNGRQGIYIAGAGTADILIDSNHIGTNRDGTAAIPNLQPGIMVENVPGSTSGNIRIMDNTISGNGTDGIFLINSSHVTIDGNMIGLNSHGDAALPNGEAGISITNANNNQIGSDAGTIQQYISGNGQEGIRITNSSGNSIARDNIIGTGTIFSTHLGNGREGVMLDGTTNTQIWPTSVAYNGRAGIALTGISAVGNNIFPFGVEANGGLPVDLGNDGATPNYPDHGATGPNLLLHYPTIDTVAAGTIHGSACPNCTVQIYRAIGNPAGAFGGGKYLTSTLANASGNWSFPLPDGLTAASLTMIAVDTTSPSSNTSEFSPRPLLFLPLLER
jgi:parallel beta-helix repeat protein